MKRLKFLLGMDVASPEGKLAGTMFAEQSRLLVLASRSIMLLLAVFLIWALFAEVDEVAIAVGSVVPQEQLKLIQHLEGGIIEAIQVEEGDIVKIGEELLKLNLGTGGINRNEKKAELDAYILTRARLQAEVDGKQPVFDPDVATRQPGLLRAELAAYQGRRREHEQALGVRSNLIWQRRLEVAELKEKQAAIQRDLVIQKQQAELSTDLLAKGLTSKVEHLQVLEKYEESRGEVAVLKQAVPRMQAALEQAVLERQEIRQQYKRRALDELATVERHITRLNELLMQADDQVRRTSVRSPIEGVVKRLRHTTIGGVVKPGEVIMEIVPLGDNLVIEAQLHPVDRGYVRTGQPVVVKVTTYDYARYGGLHGEVIRIGADSQKDPDTGVDYFVVVARTINTYLGDDPDALKITPGMEATVEIHTGSRSVMSYLVEPVLKIRNEAFRER
ncbi:MAG: HlyD family type I secretion periplasmic adaptor subunit [Granulosicoccaceae bacterium]|jgi:adhesin transport system membrane fusion protein